MRSYCFEDVIKCVEIVDGIACNKCGKKYTGDYCDMRDITDVTIHFGFGSRHDTDVWEFDLCDDCIDEMIAGFKIPPQVNAF